MSDAPTMQICSRDNAHKYFCDRLKPMKVGQSDLVFVFHQGSLVGHCMQDNKCLCTAVTICVTLFVPKFDLSILIPVNSKSRSSPMDLLHPCQLHPRSKFGDHRSATCGDNADISIFTRT